MSFNENSAMPEHTQGHVESAIKTQVRNDDVQPSVQATDRYGLERKPWLLRRYNVELSKAGKPYFAPIDSVLNQLVADAPAALAEARARIKVDTEAQEKIAALSETLSKYFDTLTDHAGEGREWLARSIAIWPLTDQVGYQLYKATSGEAELVDTAMYLLDNDANVNNQSDLEHNTRYANAQMWTDVAYAELGVFDAVISKVDEGSTEYNLAAIIRSGYQSAANLDTRNHLRGVQGNAPVTSDSDRDDIKAQILASRRAASAA